MPRKAKFHPSVMSGGPDGGDESWDQVAIDPDAEDDQDEQPGRRREASGDDRFERMQAEIDRLKEDNSLMRRAIPPAEPTTQPQAADGIDEMTDEEFDALLFSEPRKALAMNNEKLKRDLRNEYTTEQGTTKFWDQFYAANADLKEDDDLVQSTLQKNMAELANMPVDKAKSRLAELTRDRILGFMKKTRDGGNRKRAVAEGANPPTVPQSAGNEDADEQPTETLGSLLRARRARRAGRAQAA
jgi:uncharacterized protein YecA (UPF0149 family)